MVKSGTLDLKGGKKESMPQQHSFKIKKNKK
jgi:hypothetical protein